MSPQPAATTQAKQQAAAANKAAREAEARRLKDLIDESPAGVQIGRAVAFERDRAELMKRIAANRDYLRLMDANDVLDEDQAEWLEDFYPSKEKGERRSEDEVERTRLAKAAARGGVEADDDE